MSILIALGALGACGGDDTSTAPSTNATDATTAAPTTSAAPTTTAAPTTAAPTTTIDPGITRTYDIVATLASDQFGGRDQETPGSSAAQDYLIDQLAQFAQPLSGDPADPDSFRHPFANGTNLLAVIPGGELADEYVVVGAHYDHIGTNCDNSQDPSDTICNGATDNAAGVAAVLEVGRAIAADGVAPRRSVILALWDREEDGLLGAKAYVADPAVPLAQTIAYVNFDIQGANLSPSLSDVTVVVGAETGGPNLVAAVGRATEPSPLHALALSLLFGQGRSDHAVFAGVGVPSVFFTDANGPCYHTVGDDIDIVDFPKLAEQIANAERLTRDLIATDDVPVYDGTAPLASYDDAVSMLEVLRQGQADFSLFSAADQATAEQFLVDLTAIVDAGAAAFDDADVATLLGGSASLVSALATGTCDGFLD